MRTGQDREWSEQVKVSAKGGKVIIHAPDDDLKIYGEDASLSPGGAQTIARQLRREGKYEQAAKLFDYAAAAERQER